MAGIKSVRKHGRAIISGNIYFTKKIMPNATSAKIKLYEGPTLEFVSCKEARMFTFESDTVRNLSNAIRHLGVNRIGEPQEKAIREELAKVSPEELRKDILKCPEFVRGILMELKK